MKNLMNRFSVRIALLGLLFFSYPIYAASCQSSLTKDITDYAAKRLILDLLIEVQQEFLTRSITEIKQSLVVLKKIQRINLIR
ncbi:secreted protein [Beggiatoa sp. PS]|nr:secreted protein [Beggiatoa sp. PS]